MRPHKSGVDFMIMRSIYRTMIVAIAATSLVACGTLSRPSGPLRLNTAQSGYTEDQARASMDARVTNFLLEFRDQLTDEKPTNVLVLSGGGANGAYGGGVLVGWTEAGDRPVFDIVTGVSTGALSAPFAYLGSAWDHKLQEAYTSGQSDNLIGWGSFSALVNPSLFSSSRLHTLVDSYVTPELLAAIAEENAKGRLLLIATTDLDSEETIIWDMGKLASSNTPGAHQLFKNILVASASIPGVFPPMLLPAITPDGQIILEMHVDGSVNRPYLGVPEGLTLWTTSRPLDQLGGGTIYVIVNGQAGRTSAVTKGNITGILSRTWDSLTKSALRTHLAVTNSFARRNGLELKFTAIPDNVHTSALEFNQATMTALFNLARQRGREGNAWFSLDHRSTQGDFIPPDQVPESEIPAIIADPNSAPAGVIQSPNPNGEYAPDTPDNG